MPSRMRGAAGVAVLVLAWEVLARSGVVAADVVPPPTVVARRLAELCGDPAFRADTVATVLAWWIAVVGSGLVAVPAGMVLGSVRVLRDATGALVEFLRPVPSVALIPLAVSVLGSGPATKITLAVYAAMWPVLLHTVHAFAAVDPLRAEVVRSFGLSRAAVLVRLVVPSVAPFVLTGIRLASSVSLVLVISTELLVGGRGGGLGRFVDVVRAGGGGVDTVLAGAVVAGVLGVLANAGLEMLHRRLFPWTAER